MSTTIRTGAEFIESVSRLSKAEAAREFDAAVSLLNADVVRYWTERDASITACEELSKELQAARADAASLVSRYGNSCAEVASLREENAALKADAIEVENEVIEVGEREVQSRRALQAALGRAHAALLKLEAFHNFALSYSGEGAALRSEITSVLADLQGRAAAEYVAALEAEHEAARPVIEAWEGAQCIASPPCGNCIVCELTAAHAAVEALRTVKP